MRTALKRTSRLFRCDATGPHDLRIRRVALRSGGVRLLQQTEHFSWGVKGEEQNEMSPPSKNGDTSHSRHTVTIRRLALRVAAGEYLRAGI